MELRLIDHQKLSNKLCVNNVTDYSEDGRAFVISDAGVFILELYGHPLNISHSFTFKKYFISPIKYVPCENVDLDINDFHYKLPRNELYESICRIDISANLKYTNPVQPVVLNAKWSPKLNKNQSCVIGVLNSVYLLCIYAKVIDKNDIVEYKLLYNMSEQFIKLFKSTWAKNVSKFMAVEKLDELQKRVESISVTAFCWSHNFTLNNQTYIVIYCSHLNGEITAWRMKNIDVYETIEDLYFLGKYTSKMTYISELHWHPLSETSGGLSIGDKKGNISILHVTNLNKEAEYKDEVPLWHDDDNIEVDMIKVFTHEIYTFIVVVKQGIIIIFAVTEDGDVIDKKVCQIANFYITGIHTYENVLLLLTLSGTFKMITLKVYNRKLILDEKEILLKLDLYRFRMHGFFLTKNRVVLGIIAAPCRHRNTTKAKRFVNLFIFTNTLLDPFKKLWDNPTGSLADYWDYFEALRVVCFKDKVFPWEGIDPNLNYDDLSLLQLKTLRVIAKISQTVYAFIPAISAYHIKPYIILNYLVNIKLAVQRINKLLNLQNKGETLSEFQLCSIDLQNLFLKEMVAKEILPKANVGKKFIKEMYNAICMANELEYPDMPNCYWCEKKIIGPSCIPPHVDSRCALTFMPMSFIPAYKCDLCGSLYHQNLELEFESVTCVFCDLPLERRMTACRRELSMDNELSKSHLDCSEDCDKEDPDNVDIEENETEIILFSDSEEEDKEKHEKIRDLYQTLQKFSIKSEPMQDEWK